MTHESKSAASLRRVGDVQWDEHDDDWLLDIRKGLSASQRVFRIIDCFAFAAYWRSGLLRVSRADSFPDQNEGVERLFSQLTISRPGTCFGMGWNDRASGVAAHEQSRMAHFVSSWTKASDSVAMWSLYSPNALGVCIETTVGALRSAVLAMAKPLSLDGLTQEESGTRRTLCTGAMLSPVTYRSLSEIRRRVERITKAYDRVYARYKLLGKDIPSLFSMTPRQLSRLRERESALHFEPFTLKDESFSHEQEVRLTVRFGTEVPGESTMALKNIVNGDYAHRATVRSNLRAWRSATNSEVPECHWLPLPCSNVLSVALDPRMSRHHAAFWTEWFQSNAVPQRSSEAFGYVVDRLSVFPHW